MKNFLTLMILSLLLFLTACNDNKNNSSVIINPDPITQEYDITQIQLEPYYQFAWHLAYNRTFGQYYGINENAHINIEKAWNHSRGAGVTVAVIDIDYFDWEHEDLRSNVIRIYNYEENNNNIKDPQINRDDSSHGSSVAGYIASPTNGKGLVGSAPESKLILIKIDKDTDDQGTIEAFQYAIDNGAKVICCSWGTENASQGFASALSEFKEEGITIIFASGNAGINMDMPSINDESELEAVIGIGASNENNEFASYSNYGSQIDLLAPGGDLDSGVGILGIDDSGFSGSSLQRSLVTNNYAFTHGTSFAAPVAAGVAALMLSVNPTLTPDQVRDILIQSADKIGNNPNYIDGYDSRRAYGKLNAAQAVEMAQSY